MSHAVRSIRVLVAGDGAASLADCVDIDLVRAAGDRRAVAAVAAEILPDVAVVGDDPALIAAVRASSPATNVLVLAPAPDRARILDAIDAGAGGYLLADDDPAVPPDAVRAAARGESPLAPRAARALIARPLARRDGRLPGLEKRVLGLLGRGCPDEEIAERLELSPAELRGAIDVVTGALGVADRTQAALWAQRHGYDGGDGDPAHREGPFTQKLGDTETLGRIRVPARPAGKRSNGRPHDAHGCEDRPGTGGPGGDGADLGDRRLRR